VKRELILVSGFSRGGTNILWNLICSHPGVLSTGLELNEVFGPSSTKIPLRWKAAIECFAIPGLPVPGFVADYARNRIVKFAEEHARSSWGRWKSPDRLYTEDEISRLPLCTKSVNSWARDRLFAHLKRNIALKYNNVLLAAFGEVKTIYLIRDSESQCNGWMRRGCAPYDAGKWYRRIVSIMLEDYARRPDDILFVMFHEVISNPLSTARRVHEFLGLQRTDLPAFHLKSKKVLKADGKHEVLQGTEGQMMWVPAHQLGNFLDPGVDARQRDMLDSAARSALQKGLGDIVERFEQVFSAARVSA
jgi:hypothetical protein